MDSKILLDSGDAAQHPLENTKDLLNQAFGVCQLHNEAIPSLHVSQLLIPLNMCSPLTLHWARGVFAHRKTFEIVITLEL